MHGKLDPMHSTLLGFDWTTPFIADACVQLSLPVRVGPVRD